MKRYKLKKIISVFIIIFLFFSCVSTEEPDNIIDSSEIEIVENPNNVENSDNSDSALLIRMEEYLENGTNKIFEGSISEGIKQLVSVLAEREKNPGQSDKADELALMAETELKKLGAAISLEADTMWLDANMSQIAGNTTELNIQPNIILTIISETGKSLISNAPIYFEFIQGSGTFNNYATTNSFGQAGCNIIKFENLAEENIVRAYLEYRVDGYTYSFSSVVRDFVYVPPAYTAAIIVLEKSVVGISNDPLILDPVYNELKQIDYEFSIYNSVLDEEEFMQAFKGDIDSIQSLGLGNNVSYLIMLLNDCNNMIQMTNMKGDPINAFMSEARATIRVIRVIDGTVLYQKDIERNHNNGLHGQGNSRVIAALNVQRKIAGDMALDVRVNLREIQNALMGN